jgi:hypothetical protein
VPIALAGGAASSFMHWRYVFKCEVLTAHRVTDSLERHLLRLASLESGFPASVSPESAPPDDG